MTSTESSDVVVDSSIRDTLKSVYGTYEGFYHLDEEESAFFKSRTGIQDDEALKQHIIQIQAEAFEVFPYPCISRFAFTTLKISRFPAYSQLLKIGKERKGAILLDIGCCFGNDVRKAVADGFPVQGAIASDLEPGFLQLGHKLFNDSPETFPVPFIPGDVFDPSFLQPAPPFYAPPQTPVPTLSTLTNLTPLQGHISAIHASSFFHLFDEAQQFQIAQSLAGLLSPLPGSLIFGSHGGRPEKGLRVEQGAPNVRGVTMFCHSPDSWKELWDGQIFKKGTVKVEAELQEVDRKNSNSVPGAKFYFLVWSVTRL